MTNKSNTEQRKTEYDLLNAYNYARGGQGSFSDNDNLNFYMYRVLDLTTVKNLRTKSELPKEHTGVPVYLDYTSSDGNTIHLLNIVVETLKQNGFKKEADYINSINFILKRHNEILEIVSRYVYLIDFKYKFENGNFGDDVVEVRSPKEILPK
jgi:hypothetical protein